MHTNEEVGSAGRRRRRHSDEFKAQVLAACRQPGVSMAAVAMSHGINANLLRRWVVSRASASDVSKAFIPLALPVSTTETETEAAAREIRIELQRGSTTVKVNWPTNAASECAAWMRELLR